MDTMKCFQSDNFLDFAKAICRTMVLMIGLSISPALAIPMFDYSEDPSLYGETANACDSSRRGQCAATAAINGFYFLENKYPWIYHNLLTPNGTGTKANKNQSDPTDRNSFSASYFNQDSYKQHKAPLAYSTEKQQWIDSKVPGTTSVVYSFNQSGLLPFLATQIKDQEAVEIWISNWEGTGIDHAVNLFDIGCTHANYTGCFVKILDPNNPNGPPLTMNASGNKDGKTINLGNDSLIIAGFAESPTNPTPLPTTLPLFAAGLGFIALFSRGRSRGLPSGAR